MAEYTQPDITSLTVQLLSAFVSNNSVSSEGLADLIISTRAALTASNAVGDAQTDAPSYQPAVSVRKSLASPDHILSLIDGKPYKTLKRHLSANGLTIDEYRQRYNLPPSYPVVAPSFAARRREIAAKIGLGQKRPVAVPAKSDAPAPSSTGAPAPDKAARKSKAAKPKTAAPKTDAPVAKEATVKSAPRKQLSIAAPKPSKASPETASVTNAAPSGKKPDLAGAKAKPSKAASPAGRKPVAKSQKGDASSASKATTPKLPKATDA